MALVFAMIGGAYAANNSSDGGKATASAKAKKGPRGPKGATGAPGAKGDAGAAGGVGPTGPQGPQGPKGTNGTNGAPGATGPKGDPWTAGGTLPSGATETGSWAMFATFPKATFPFVPIAISYPIPLAEPSESVEILDMAETEASAGSGKCELELANLDATPVAPPGTLCIFTRSEHGLGGEGELKFVGEGFEENEQGDTPTGGFLWVNGAENGIIDFRGSWAVTAPAS